MEFTTKEVSEILSTAREKPVPEQRVRTWSRPGNLLGNPERARGTGETRGSRELVYTFTDLLAADICLTLEWYLKDAHNSVAAWLASMVMDKLDGVKWADLPEEVIVDLIPESEAKHGAAPMAVNVHVRELADMLKARAAIWQVQSGRRVV